MPVSEQTYLQLVLEDSDEIWELHCGRLWSKPPMTWEHLRLTSDLGFQLRQQLPRDRYLVAEEGGRARRSSTQYYAPDLMVISVEMARRLFTQEGMVAVFPEGLPFVAEVWSPSTGRLDVWDKVPEYQRRGDLEIWLLHPYERTVTAWRKQDDGTYTETRYEGGTVQPASLPGVSIDLDALFSM
jgi:Uma2 family endonuclease